MKSQYQEAIDFIANLKPHFKTIAEVSSENEVTDALIDALGVVAVSVTCGWHGDSYKGSKVFIMTKEEAKVLKEAERLGHE
jgi:spermidine/putrescine-binding protein